MEFRNLTPFPAMAFDALDQHDQRFHTAVMRLTFDVRDDGTLTLAPVQTPLVTTDEYHGELNRSSVKQESDLAPYKPHTDVIVIADAHAPNGQASAQFAVMLKINDAPSDAVEGSPILRKVLMIRGAREWRKRHPLTRALSMFTLAPWRLTAPQPIATLPLRYEYAYGGENKVLVTDQAAKRVDGKHRLPGRVPQTGDVNPNDPQEAIAHSACDQNPVGRGFAENWYLHATNTRRMPAAQIETSSQPIARFAASSTPQGLGVVGRAWRPRIGLAGTYDQQWVEQRHPNLPADFDFAYWNGAPADQQVTPHLIGDESVTLANLCPAGAGAVKDASGNTCLSFSLPGHLPFVLVRFEDGRIGELAAKLDTLIIDTAADANNPAKKTSVVCVWRATVASEPGVRVLEARMLTRADVAALRQP
ncbi:hypothetical protein JOD97_005844 [Duganella sp. 1411]|uniref:DUF2169 family type VI secretion system accessory protein n=1 Tax=Duganella sp. 1411 TaxID=2806572 RepID=UPI001AE933E4|nr:DUF2169 domain-containing protein [Duganella sp. 1411]MBP1207761.1 hypothetical protein [Duganella sp. 1411]